MSNPFDNCADDYDRFRPHYPHELYEMLIARLALTPDSRILDVAAGTGRASSPLRSAGLRVIHLEASHAMALRGRRSNGGDYICATVEAIPLRPASIDAIVCGQAFHWFDPDRALPELAAVLRPGGCMAVFWNDRDTAGPASKVFEDMVRRYNPEHVCSYRQRDWARVFEQGGRFRTIHSATFKFAQPMSVDEWIGLARSISYVRKIGDGQMAAFERDLREGLQRCETQECAYDTHFWIAVVCR